MRKHSQCNVEKKKNSVQSTPYDPTWVGMHHYPDQTANIQWITEKGREFQKNIYFCFTDDTKALTVWITTNCGKFFKRWEYQIT